MNENEIIDDSLLENIEGLLFSEEYADSEGNSSLISEIAEAEIPTEEKSDENGEGTKESDASKSDSQNNNVKENVLNIDYSEDDFEKGFDSFAIERLSDSIRTNKGVRRLFIEKASIKDRLTSNFPIWAYGESEQFSLTSFMKEGFGSESLRDPVGTGRESVKPVVSDEKSKVSVENIKVTEPLANQEKPKTLTRGALRFENTNNSAEDGKEQKFNLINTEVPKVSRDPEKKNVFAEAERLKAPARDVLHVEKPNKSVEKDNGLKFNPVNTEVPKVSRIPEKKNVFAEAERSKAPARDSLCAEKPNKSVEKDNGLKFDPVNTEVPKVSKDSEKKNVFAEPEKPKAPARDVLRVEKSNKSVEKDNGLKFDPVNTEVPKVSKDPEKKNVFAEPEKPKAPARDVLRVEKSNKSVEKDNGLKFDPVNTEVPKVSKGSEKINVFAEPEKTKAPVRDILRVEKPDKSIEKDNGLKFDSVNTEVPKVSKDSEKKNVFANPERPKAPAREALRVEKLDKSIEKDNGLKFDSVNTEVPKVSKDSEKKNVFANPERPKAPAREALRVEKTNKLSESGKELKFNSINTDVLKVSKDSEKTKLFASPERPNASARDSFGDERLNKSVDVCKETKCDSINKEISKASSVDSNKSMDSKKLEKAKPAPKKDFAEFKNDYKNIAANNAISITGDKSLSFTSSCSQKQDEMFLDTNEKAKRNSFDNQSFNGFRKDISRYTIPQRTSCFSLTGRFSTKMNFDNAIEKKSRMSMFNERKSSAYNCMKNDFKHKKELF